MKQHQQRGDDSHSALLLPGTICMYVLLCAEYVQCMCVCADKCRSLNVYVALIEAKVSVASI